MAKKRIDMSKITLGSAKPIVKKTPTAGDEAVAKIHQPAPDPVPKESTPVPSVQAYQQEPARIVEVRRELVEEVPSVMEAEIIEAPVVKRKAKKKTVAKKDLVRITVDLFKPLHKKVKIKALTQDQSIRDYITSLIERDLKK